MMRSLKGLAKALERLGSLEAELGTRSRRKSTTSPNQILHTFDSNLHTLLDEPGGAARILTLKEGVRVQWHDHVHIHIYDIPKGREEVSATHLDMVSMAKEHAKFPVPREAPSPSPRAPRASSFSACLRRAASPRPVPPTSIRSAARAVQSCRG